MMSSIAIAAAQSPISLPQLSYGGRFIVKLVGCESYQRNSVIGELNRWAEAQGEPITIMAQAANPNSSSFYSLLLATGTEALRLNAAMKDTHGWIDSEAVKAQFEIGARPISLRPRGSSLTNDAGKKFSELDASAVHRFLDQWARA